MPPSDALAPALKSYQLSGRRLAGWAMAGMAALSGLMAFGQTMLQWNPVSDGTFSNGVNWTGGIAPADDLTSNIAVYSGGAFALNVATPQNVAGILINGGNKAITGSALTVGAAGITATGDAGGLWTLNSGGQLLTFNASTGSLAIGAAVPEPSTWAAMAGGLALGWVTWRRRSRRA